MSGLAAATFWQRIDHAERVLCLKANLGCRRRLIKFGFAAVSRLGDGVVWYVLMALLPLVDAGAGGAAALRMAVGGAVATVVYKALKQRCVRERPYVSHPGILCGTAPLDRYSFPSGHTLHAVSFTLLAGSYDAWLLLPLVPFAILVGASRVVLGLHYPTDVAAGALIGAGLAGTILAVWPY